MTSAASLALLEFDSSSTVDGDSVLRYLEENTVKGDLRITSLFTNDHLQALQTLLVDNHASITLTGLMLPNNSLTEESGSILAKILHSQNETLRRLDLTQNPLKVSGFDKLREQLICSRLCSLNLTKTMLGSQGATAVALILKNNQSLEELNLSHNNLGNKGMKTIAPALQNNEWLRVLNLSYNKINSKGGNVLAKTIENSPKSKIKTLDISSNKIGNTGIQAFVQWLTFDTRIEGFYASSIDLGAEGAIHLAKVLEFNYKLRHLKLSGNQLGPMGSKFLLEGLANNQSTALETLDLSWNAITVEGATSLAQVLKENSKLQVCNLEGNQIGDIGCIALSESLQFNLMLNELILTDNQIETEGAFSLAMALGKPSCSLENIKWDKNPIMDEGLAVLSGVPQLKRNQEQWLQTMLKKISNKALASINLQQKRIGDIEVILLTEALIQYCPVIRTFWVNGETLSSRSLLPLVERGLSSSSNIKRFYLKETKIGDDIASAFGQILQQNTTLEVLSLTNCSITSEGASRIAQGLKYNSALRRLNLDRNNIRDDGLIEILFTLPHPTLTAISACDNQITDESMKIKTLKHLTELCLNGNLITDLGTLKLCEVLMEGCQLSRLSLRDNNFNCRGGQALRSFLPDSAICEF